MAERIESESSEIRRIDFTGTIWFAVASLAATIALVGARLAGWSPLQLDPEIAIVWWTGAVLTLAAIAAFAWAGCPVLGFSVDRADRQKSLCIRVGVVLYLAGGTTALMVMLFS